VNGVVFFNPFDMGGQDATDMMDRCCGHPAPTGEYHYHKYPICVNSPWADDGSAHSPLLGWAFDGYPLYGPTRAPTSWPRMSPASTRSTNSTCTTMRSAAGITT